MSNILLIIFGLVNLIIKERYNTYIGATSIIMGIMFIISNTTNSSTLKSILFPIFIIVVVLFVVAYIRFIMSTIYLKKEKK